MHPFVKKSRTHLSIPIYCVETKKYYNSIAHASRAMKIDHSLIAKVIRKELNTTHGYTFKKFNGKTHKRVRGKYPSQQYYVELKD